MKYSLFLADTPRTLGKPDYPSYPQLLSVECAAGSQARQLAQALPHSALTVAGRPLETLTVGATPLTPGACLEPGRTQLTQPAAVSTLYVLRGMPTPYRAGTHTSDAHRKTTRRLPSTTPI